RSDCRRQICRQKLIAHSLIVDVNKQTVLAITENRNPLTCAQQWRRSPSCAGLWELTIRRIWSRHHLCRWSCRAGCAFTPDLLTALPFLFACKSSLRRIRERHCIVVSVDDFEVILARAISLPAIDSAVFRLLSDREHELGG